MASPVHPRRWYGGPRQSEPATMHGLTHRHAIHRAIHEPDELPQNESVRHGAKNARPAKERAARRPTPGLSHTFSLWLRSPPRQVAEHRGSAAKLHRLRRLRLLHPLVGRPQRYSTQLTHQNSGLGDSRGWLRTLGRHRHVAIGIGRSACEDGTPRVAADRC